jgi:FixJ family two-component response regulator
LDGLELIGVLRSRGIEAPVVLISGHANKELRARAQKLGIHCQLENPCRTMRSRLGSFRVRSGRVDAGST